MARVVRRHAEYALRPENRARFLIAHIVLADMRAIGAELDREVGAIIDEKCRARRLRDRHQSFAGMQDHIVGTIFETKLNARDIARAKRSLEPIGEAAQRITENVWRRNEIEPAGRMMSGRHLSMLSADFSHFDTPIAACRADHANFDWNPIPSTGLPQADGHPTSFHEERPMSRNPDGTFKSGDPETRETARRGGEASGGSRQALHGPEIRARR